MSSESGGVSVRRFVRAHRSATTPAPRSTQNAVCPGENAVIAARQAGEAANVTVHALRGNVSLLLGAGGNIAVLPGRDGKLVVDSGYFGARWRIADALTSLSPDPIRHLVNTHWHFDHTDGNEWMHAAGATITAHENTRKHLSTATRVEDWNFTFAPAHPGAIPTDVFDAHKTLQLNGATITLEYYGPSHTDGDLSVYFAEADVLVTGDTFWNGHYPFIDYSTGGSIDGLIHAAEANLAITTDKTIVVPGHGPVGDRSELIEFRDMLVAIRGHVAALHAEGRSVDDIVAAKPTAYYDSVWGGFFIGGDLFTRLVHKGLTQNTPDLLNS